MEREEGRKAPEKARLKSGAALMIVAALSCLAAVCRAETTKGSLVPAPTVAMDADTLKSFQDEVKEYVALRTKVLAKLPPTSKKATPEELAAHQHALTEAIVAARKGEERGDIFEPPVEAAIRRIVRRAFEGPDGAAIAQGIKQGNPTMEGNPEPGSATHEVKEPVKVAVNAVYNPAAPSSSVPPSLLLELPQLPEQIRYQFVGRTLILRDTDANVILDFIPDVAPDPSIKR